MRVFKNRFGGFETLYQSKTVSGEVIKYYMPVSFQKDCEPVKDSLIIEPIRWWGSCYTTKDGQTKPKLFISQWREIEEILLNNGNKENESINDYHNDINPDDLPFY